jgi:hypothetical protein
MYTYDPTKEKPTVKVRMLPHKYVRIMRVGDEKARLHHLDQQVVLNPKTGNKKLEFVPGPVGEFWVPPRIAGEICGKQGGDRTSETDVQPMAMIVETGGGPEVDPPTPAIQGPAKARRAPIPAASGPT